MSRNSYEGSASIVGMADTTEEVTFDIGDVVHDRDDDDPNNAVVVNTPSKLAHEWHAHKGKSVAADNPDYPDDAPVIVVAFAEALQPAFPDWEGAAPLPLTAINDSEASHYSFPAPRLTDAESSTASKPTSDSEPPSDSVSNVSPSDDPATTAAELSASMRALKERLEEGGMSVEIEADGQALQATKLGDIYRVRPGEIIEGDGALRPQLSSIVHEFSDSS